MRTGTEHRIGAGIDHRVGERDRVTAVLAEEDLGSRPDLPAVDGLGSVVDGDQDQIGLGSSLPHLSLSSCNVN